MGLLELLEAGDVEGFNNQRGERSRPDLFAADLPGKALVAVDLSNANVDKADLTGSDLSEANLFRASFTGIDGSGLVLRAAIAIKARFKEAWLDGSDLTGADLSRADLSEANVSGSRGEGLRLVGARLREVTARDVRWEGVDLSEASLHKANLTGADLRRADLTEASGAEAVLDGARLDFATATGLKLPSASLKGTSLVGARLLGANLAGADLTGADLSNVDLTRANLTGATLTGATMRGAVLVDACLDGVDLDGLDLDGVDFSGVDPGSLELSADQRGAVAAIGVQADPDAPLRFEGIEAARNEDRVAVVWDNADSEDVETVRFAVLGGERPVVGVLPVPAESVLARAVAPLGDGFAVVLIRERTGGVVSVVLELSRDGELGRSRTTPLGYEPSVRPVVRGSGDSLVMWGLARRGPTLVVHRLDDEGLAPARSEQQSTAQHFLGRHLPVIACKGGVIMPATEAGAGKPLRAPEGFPGELGLAVPVQIEGEPQVLAVWLERRVGDKPGGLRTSWLVSRGSPEVEVLSRVSGVVGLDAVVDGESVLVAWVEAGEGGLGASTVYRVRLPGGEPEVVASELVDVQELAFAPGPGGPRIVLTTLAEEVAVLDELGSPAERLQGEGS